jgi:hypothetical protein
MAFQWLLDKGRFRPVPNELKCLTVGDIPGHHIGIRKAEEFGNNGPNVIERMKQIIAQHEQNVIDVTPVDPGQFSR